LDVLHLARGSAGRLERGGDARGVEVARLAQVHPEARLAGLGGPHRARPGPGRTVVRGPAAAPHALLDGLAAVGLCCDAGFDGQGNGLAGLHRLEDLAIGRPLAARSRRVLQARWRLNDGGLLAADAGQLGLGSGLFAIALIEAGWALAALVAPVAAAFAVAPIARWPIA